MSCCDDGWILIGEQANFIEPGNGGSYIVWEPIFDPCPVCNPPKQEPEIEIEEW